MIEFKKQTLSAIGGIVGYAWPLAIAFAIGGTVGAALVSAIVEVL